MLLRLTFCSSLMAICLMSPSALAIVEKKAGKVGFSSMDGRRFGEAVVGSHPHEMAFSPDRRFLYVTDNGVLWMTDKGAGGNTISIIDVRLRRKTGAIELGDLRPHGIAVMPDGEIVVTIENPFGLLRLDSAAQKLVRRYNSGGDSPHMVLLGPEAATAWVTNSGSGAVAFVNLSSGVVENTIRVGGIRKAAAFPPMGSGFT
jgi:DNA-binding beta-propeller fold protein YncE